MLPQRGQNDGQIAVAGSDQAAVAKTAQIFGGVEGKTANMPQTARLFPSVHAPDGLGAVLHNAQAVPGGYGRDLLHAAGRAEDVHRQNCASSGGDLFLDLFGVKGVVLLANVGKYRYCADRGHRLRSGEKGKGRRNDLVPRSDAAGAQRQNQRLRSVAAPEGVLHAQITGNLRFKLFDIGTADEGTALHHLSGALCHFAFQGLVLAFEVKKRYVHMTILLMAPYSEQADSACWVMRSHSAIIRAAVWPSTLTGRPLTTAS